MFFLYPQTGQTLMCIIYSISTGQGTTHVLVQVSPIHYREIHYFDIKTLSIGKWPGLSRQFIILPSSGLSDLVCVQWMWLHIILKSSWNGNIFEILLQYAAFISGEVLFGTLTDISLKQIQRWVLCILEADWHHLLYETCIRLEFSSPATHFQKFSTAGIRIQHAATQKLDGKYKANHLG